jgi:threonine/homoserine/homoserine lactone efflux protein
MDLSILFAAAVAGFVYGITPGPGVLAVLGIGAGQGRRAAGSFLVGHLAGDVVWSTLALVAIIGVTSVGTLVFDLLGLVSGVYLFWLGFRAVRVRRGSGGKIDEAARLRHPLWHGVVFGATNPKAYPVAVATLTALLSAKAGLLTWAMLPALVAASWAGGALAYMVLVAAVGASAVRRLYLRHEILITRASGVMFMGFAVHALTHSLPGLLSPKRA